MITGRVTAHGEAVVPLYVGGSGDQGRQIDTVIDTGFNGFLTLPAALKQELGLVWRRRGRAESTRPPSSPRRREALVRYVGPEVLAHL